MDTAVVTLIASQLADLYNQIVVRHNLFTPICPDMFGADRVKRFCGYLAHYMCQNQIIDHKTSLAASQHPLGKEIVHSPACIRYLLSTAPALYLHASQATKLLNYHKKVLNCAVSLGIYRDAPGQRFLALLTLLAQEHESSCLITLLNNYQVIEHHREVIRQTYHAFAQHWHAFNNRVLSFVAEFTELFAIPELLLAPRLDNDFFARWLLWCRRFTVTGLFLTLHFLYHAIKEVAIIAWLQGPQKCYQQTQLHYLEKVKKPRYRREMITLLQSSSQKNLPISSTTPGYQGELMALENSFLIKNLTCAPCTPKLQEHQKFSV